MRSHIRSLISIALLVALLLTAFPASAAAADNSALEQAIIDSYTRGNQVNISQYRLTPEELHQVFIKLLYGGKLPWYAQSTYNQLQYEGNTYVSFFIPQTLDATQYDRTLYEQQVAQILAEVVHPGMSAVQKALAIHDYLIAHCAYDESLEKNTGYDLLVNGSTVCAGYADAYMDLMNRLGIECITVASDEMEHAWNLIRIDESWYHVDLTWDDPSPNVYGQVRHQYFLLTDEEMLAEGDEGHYGWETEITCTDSCFSDAYWRDVESQICFTDSTACYFREDIDWTGHIRYRTEETGEETTLHSNKKQYINIGYGKYSYTHTGLSLWNERLYFSDLNTVYSTDLNGSDLRTEYRYDTGSNQRFIYGSFVENDTLYLALGDHEFEHISLEVSLEPTDYHKHSYQDTVIAPTCLDSGITIHTCNCGITFESDPTDATGHDYHGETSILPTPFKNGEMCYTCTACGDCYTADLPKISFITWIFQLLEDLFF